MTTTTTIKIPTDCLPWWKSCCAAKGLNSSELFAEFRSVVKARKQNAFYLSLLMPSGYKKPLAGIKIVKGNDNNRVVQKVYGKSGADLR